MKRRTAKAAALAVWSPSSSETWARAASEERTSVGLKQRAAKVDLPDPAGPTSRTSAPTGRSMTRGLVVGDGGDQLPPDDLQLLQVVHVLDAADRHLDAGLGQVLQAPDRRPQLLAAGAD